MIIFNYIRLIATHGITDIPMDIQPPAGDFMRYNLGPWIQNHSYRTHKGLFHTTSYKCFMNWRSQCKRQLRIVRCGNSVKMSGSGVHSHSQETRHRLTVATMTSITSAVRHNLTKSSSEIRRSVSTEEAPLTPKDMKKVH